MTKFFKRIALDALGVFLIIIAVPIGWLPGPGGIPLALIGLSLLAKNNQWARDLMDDFELKVKYYSKQLLRANPKLLAALDIACLSVLGTGLYLAFKTSGLSAVAGAALITSSLILLLLNRERGVRIYNRLMRKKP
jgi:hypothetical protein